MHILLPSLYRLSIHDCPQVEFIFNAGLPSNLNYMHLSNCSKLIASLIGALGANTSLETLHIGKVDVESFPDEGLLPLSLTSLWIYKCPYLKKMNYKDVCHLSSLKELILEDCPNLQCLPEEGLPKSISTLDILDCTLLKQRCLGPKGEDWGNIIHIKNVWVDHKLVRWTSSLKLYVHQFSYVYIFIRCRFSTISLQLLKYNLLFTIATQVSLS